MTLKAARAACASIAVCLLLGACAAQDVALAVDLRTDLVPGADFFGVRHVLDGNGLHVETTAAAFGVDAFDEGLRVAEIHGVRRGEYRLVTELLDAARRRVASRTTDITISGDFALTVVVSRDCVGVMCPLASAPQLSTCYAGQCVDPSCSSVDHSACPPDCRADSDCPPQAACATPRCADGACLYVPGDSCATGERCDPEVGCVPTSVRCSAPLSQCGADCLALESDPHHCGDCTEVCSPPANGTATCDGSVCGFSCDAGFHHCGGACDAARCETTFTTAGTSMYPVPDGCTRLGIVAWGAGGGRGSGAGAGAIGGGGGFASATIAVTAGEMLTVVVGEPGVSTTTGTGGTGGAPGGGRGGTGGAGGGGGGGYTGLFRGTPSAATALLIAGAGAGSGGRGYLGAAGGGFSGGSSFNGGAGGTQTMGGATNGAVPGTPGSSLAGGVGGSRSDGGGGGGAGFYGGGGSGGASSNASGGGGGSGYVTPDASTFALASGIGSEAASPDDPRRGTAGDPARAGLVLLSCE